MNLHRRIVGAALPLCIAIVLGGCSGEDAGDDSTYDGPYCELSPWSCDELVQGPDLLEPRRYPRTVVLDDGRVLVYGGSRENDDGSTQALSTTELVDPVSGEVTGAGSLSRPRLWAAKAGDGSVLAHGGKDGETDELLLDVERFDPDTESWSVLDTSLAALRHETVELADGKVLFVGGEDENEDAVHSVDLYDPEQQTISAVAPTNEAQRYWHLTLLPDGRVLAMVGENDEVDEESHGRLRGEIYDPSVDTWTPIQTLELGTWVSRRIAVEPLDDEVSLVVFAHRELDEGVETPINATTFAWLSQVTAVTYDADRDEWTELETFDEVVGGLEPGITWLPEAQKYLIHLYGDTEEPTYGYLFDPGDDSFSYLYERRPVPGRALGVLPGDQVLFYSYAINTLQLYDAPNNAWEGFDAFPDRQRLAIEFLPDCQLFFLGPVVEDGVSTDSRRDTTAFCTPG